MNMNFGMPVHGHTFFLIRSFYLRAWDISLVEWDRDSSHPL